MCLVSVLMSVYNEPECFLRKSIESILNQTFRDFEFIIFDDASQYGAGQIVFEYQKSDNRIIYIRNPENKGLTFNLNKGLDMAKGKYIARMDADDIAYPNRLKKEVDYMNQHLECAMVASDYYIFRDGKLEGHPPIKHSHRDIRTRLLFGNSDIMHSTVMMRRSFLEANHLNYDVTIKKAQDYDLWVRIAGKGNIMVLSDKLLAYRVHDKQVTNTSRMEQLAYEERTICRHLEMLLQNITSDEEKCYLKLIKTRSGLKLIEAFRFCCKLFHSILTKRNYNLRIYLFFMVRCFLLITRLNIRCAIFSSKIVHMLRKKKGN